jgi:hypothetical protein
MSASLPFLALKLSQSDTSAPLQGIPRRGGLLTEDEEASRRRRLAVHTPLPTDGATRLNRIAAELRQPATATSLAARWRTSMQASMAFKQHMYTRERDSLQQEILDAQVKAAAFVSQARSGGLADSQTPTWEVVERVSNRWQALVLQSAALDRVVETARERRDLIQNTGDFAELRSEFAFAIESLAADYPSLPVLLECVADLVDAFIKQPLVTNGAFLNFVLLGEPGVGKTRLATSLANLLGKIGLLVYDQLVVCGRSDFIASYEGQTATKSRTFLVSNLEKIMFLDEAYSLTTYDRDQRCDGDERRLSVYSEEAVAELVGFLSQRVGSFSLITAGYEQQMLNDFLPSNPGLGRRFPYRVWLQRYSPEQLVHIFMTALASALSDPPPAPRLTRETAQTFFTALGIAFLTDVLGSTQSDDRSLYPLVGSLFAAQAGAMSAVANTTAVLISSSKLRGEIGVNNNGIDSWAIGYIDVYNILATLLQQQLGPSADDAILEVQAIAKQNGWLASGAWQVPPDRVSSQPSLRKGKTR